MENVMNEYELVVIIENFKKHISDFNVDIFDLKDSKCASLHVLLSSFSNANGGKIIFGLDPNTYDVIGIEDYEVLKVNILNVCQNMVPVLEPEFSLYNIGGKKVLELTVPKIDDSLKPVYHIVSSMFDKAFIREGYENVELSKLDIQLMKIALGHHEDEIRAYQNIDYHELDEKLVTTYIDKVKEQNQDAKNLEYEDILNLCKITQDYAPTLIGLLVFAKDPTKFFENYYVEIFRSKNDESTSLKKCTGKLVDILNDAVSFIMNESTIPVKEEIIKECILNCLLHRDYSKNTEKMPITITLYDKKIIFKNPGGLYGKNKISMLDKGTVNSINPILRNLISIFIDNTNDIPKMNKTLKEDGFPPLEFVNKNGQFMTNLYFKHRHTQDDLIAFCKTEKTIEEIRKYMNVETVFYAMDTYVEPLLNDEKLQLTIPEFPQSKFQKYIAK